MGDQQSEFSYYQIGGFRPNVTLQGCSTTFFFSQCSIQRSCDITVRAHQYDMRKLAEAIVDSNPSVDLVLGTLSLKISGLVLRRYGQPRDRNQTLWGFVDSCSYFRMDKKGRV